MPLTIKKRGEVYYARGTIAGQRVYESTGCRRRADAQAGAARYERQIRDRHTLGAAATLTFWEAAQDYMDTGGEARFLRPIILYFGPDKLAADIDNAALNAAARATVNRQLIGPVRAVRNQAAEDGKLPLRRFRNRKVSNARTRWLTPGEAEALVAAAADHLRPVLVTLLGTGARVSELLGAQVPHFHADTGEIFLEDTKNDHPRMLRMPARSRDAILAAGIPVQGALFRRPGTKSLPYALGEGQAPIKKSFRSACVAAGLGPEVTPHVLRHTWATWYYAATRDFGGLLDLGGWRQPSMAMRYRKIAPDNLAADLATHGWDFTRLGSAMPAAGSTLRLVDNQ